MLGQPRESTQKMATGSTLQPAGTAAVVHPLGRACAYACHARMHDAMMAVIMILPVCTLKLLCVSHNHCICLLFVSHLSNMQVVSAWWIVKRSL